jgi:serine/threonine protein kinase
VTVRRYEPLLKIASGGTASVWVGAAAGALGFRQLVAIKRPHAHLADDPGFVTALVEEAKIASRLRHANAVDVRDVEVDETGVQLVMDWVEGVSLSDLIRAWLKEPPLRPHACAIRIVLDACEGLRALHELASDEGAPLGCVHRDVSPANVLVGLDGVGRITDFGLTRPLLAVDRTTSEGALRGKLGYMAPEYIRGKGIDHRVDVFATAIVLWEALACRRLWRGENDAETLERVQREEAPKLTEVASSLGRAAEALDALLVRALAKEPAERIGSIGELATELERIAREHDLIASHVEVRDSFGATLRASLEERRREVQRALAASGSDGPVSGSSSIPRSSVPPSPAWGARNTMPGTPHALRTEGAGDAVRVGPAPVERRRNALPWTIAAVAGGVVLVAGTLLAVMLLRSASPPAPGTGNTAAVRVVEPDVQALGESPRARAEVVAPSASASPKTRPPRSSNEPGNKPPRPNPYGGSKR